MRTQRMPSKTFPKISTMPRQRTEATHHLDMYKLSVEKTRIQQELEYLDQRRQRLMVRLAAIHQQTDDLEHLAGTQPRSGEPSGQARASDHAPTSNVYLPERATAHAPTDYSTVVLDY